MRALARWSQSRRLGAPWRTRMRLVVAAERRPARRSGRAQAQFPARVEHPLVHTGSVRIGQLRGRLERSSKPAWPLASKRRTQRCAHWRDTPIIAAHGQWGSAQHGPAARATPAPARSDEHHPATWRPPGVVGKLLSTTPLGGRHPVKDSPHRRVTNVLAEYNSIQDFAPEPSGMPPRHDDLLTLDAPETQLEGPPVGLPRRLGGSHVCDAGEQAAG